MLGIKANGVYSASAFPDVVFSGKKATPPKKKSVFETVPFMSGHYDFTEVYGAAAYESRSVVYELTAANEDAAALESTVSEVVQWLYGIADTEIYDDMASGYHYLGTCGEVGVSWSGSGRIAKITATITCYPFRLSNEATTMTLAAGTYTLDNGGFPATVTATPAAGAVTVTIGSKAQAVSTETVLDTKLPTGKAIVTITNGTATLSWREEVI